MKGGIGFIVSCCVSFGKPHEKEKKKWLGDLLSHLFLCDRVALQGCIRKERANLIHVVRVLTASIARRMGR